MNSKKIFFWVAILTCLLFSAAGQISATPNTDSSALIINEFVATNGAGLTDEDGEHPDWIEIYNRSQTAINLAGWALSDDPDQPQKWSFPDMTLASHEYLVVFASGKDRRVVQPGAALHTNFKLAQEGDFLALSNVLEGQMMDVVEPKYPEQFRDVAYGRLGEELAYGYLALPTPGGPNDETRFWAGLVAPVEFSARRGFYEAPLTVRLTTATPDAEIRYTTDGSEPSESHGTLYADPIPVQATTLLRAMAFKPEFLPSVVNTESCLFLDDVLSQPANPPDFPAYWGARLETDAAGNASVSPVAADYEMNPAVVNDPDYKGTIKDDLKSLPVMSVVMTTETLAKLHARFSNNVETEPEKSQPVSVELIYPNGDQPGFQINAGIRPVEPNSGESAPKQSFELLFKRSYGPTELEYPLFIDSPAEEYNSLVLQAGPVNEPAAYSRDQWLYDSQRTMSGVGPSGMFVHLYLNGLYWGVYNVMEDPDEAFLATYLGGDKEDWFMLSRAGILDQDLDDRVDRLNYLFTLLSLAGPFNDGPEPYKNLAGLYAEAASYLDPAQFSDFMILNWYSQLLGWPENDWRMVINRPQPMGSGQFLIWNQEDTNPEADDHAGFTNLSLNGFDPINPIFEIWLQNPDFRMQLADRLYKHLANNGALSDTQAQARWLKLNQTLERAIIGDSARWGDSGQGSPFTPEKWRSTNEAISASLKDQAARMMAWARKEGYYPTIDPPLFSQEGGMVEAGFSLMMTLPAGATQDSAIYYTTDGSDPRLPVTGDVGFSAVPYNAPLTLSYNTVVRARLRVGSTWSALHEATFSVTRDDNTLRITEVMYNPGEGDDSEFVELKNVGTEPMDLANVSFVEGIYYIFPANAPPLGPGEFAVLVSDPDGFAELYPDVPISGVYDGHLSNKGEQVVLLSAEGEPLAEFGYDDANGWPITPDGRGDSLTLASPDGDPNNPQNWRASTNLNGSPGADDPAGDGDHRKS